MYGYKSIGEFITTWLKAYNTQIFLKYLLPFFILIDTFFKWVFVSVNGIYFLILLYTIDFLTGIGKAIYFSLKIRQYKKEGKEIPKHFEEKKLVSKKFPRFLITMLCSVMLLGLLQFAGIHSIVFIPLFSIFYAAFVAQQLISIAENLSEVGIISNKIFKKLSSKITSITDKF